jgi:HSP20 family protein
MTEVKVERPVKAVARPETPALTPFGDLFAPGFPVDRFFGLSPFAVMREFTNEMDRVFRGNAPALKAWTPTVDIQKVNGDLLVTAELPGLKKEDVKIEMTDKALIIEGERKRETKEDHEGYHRYERTYGNFYRAIPLPEGARAEAVKAELTDGVLKIAIPIAEAKKNVHQIKIEEAAPVKKPVAA